MESDLQAAELLRPKCRTPCAFSEEEICHLNLFEASSPYRVFRWPPARPSMQKTRKMRQNRRQKPQKSFRRSWPLLIMRFLQACWKRPNAWPSFRKCLKPVSSLAGGADAEWQVAASQ